MQEFDMCRHRFAFRRLISDIKHALQAKLRNSLIFLHIYRHFKKPIRCPYPSVPRRVSTANDYGSRCFSDHLKVIRNLGADFLGRVLELTAVPELIGRRRIFAVFLFKI